MTRALLCLIFALAAPFARPAGNGVGIDGGGGIEQSLLYAWANLDDLIAPCLGDVTCYRAPNGMKVLDEITWDQVQERNAGNLKFIEDSSSAVEWKTGDHVGAPIEFNLVPIFNRGHFDLVDALDLLLQALETHHPDIRTPDFAQTREGLREFWRARLEAQDLRKIGHGGVIVMTVTRATQRVLAGNGDGYQDLNGWIERNLTCSQLETPSLIGLNGFYWLEPQAESRTRAALPLFGQIRYTCVARDGSTRSMQGNFELVFSAKIKNGDSAHFLLEPGKFELSVDVQRPRLLLFDLH